MIFSGDNDESVNFAPPGELADAKPKKAIKVPNGSKGLHVVFVQNEDSFKSVYIFDRLSFYNWKKAQDFSTTWPKMHEFRISPDEVIIGFYGRYGTNSIKSLGIIVYKHQIQGI